MIVKSQNYPDVSIRAKANNKYVSAENGGASPLVANRDSANSKINYYFKYTYIANFFLNTKSLGDISIDFK